MTAEEVALAHRLLLGRDPTEAEAAACRAAPSAGALRARIMATPEFAAALPGHAVMPDAAVAPPDIEVETSPAARDALFRHVERNWRQLGAVRPYWSVLARDEFLPEQIGGAEDAFVASGEHSLAQLLASLARHRLAADSFAEVFDFGCGVGRVTLPLAARFARVTGADISPEHLTIARLRGGRAGARNLGFSLVTTADFGMVTPFDLWVSQAVLQHNPPPVIARMLERMFALLAPGGVAVFQLPTFLAGYRFRAAEYLAKPPDPGTLEIHVLPQSEVFACAARAGCVPLEVSADGTVWPPAVCTSNLFVFRKPW